MMQTVRGVYRDGRVELLEPPSGITEGEVLVIFGQFSVGEAKSTKDFYKEKSAPDNSPRRLYFGMFSGEGKELTLEDFREAEFRGDDDGGLDWT